MARLKRGLKISLMDRTMGWWCGLPRESCSFSLKKVSIPVGDDVELAAIVYLPKVSKPRGTILIRTSYGIGPTSAIHARFFAARGYQVLHAACRGTHRSDGCDFVPAVHEQADGHATIEWMRAQPWYTGSFGMVGGSYLGYTQWAVLCDPPHDMKAAVITTGMADMSEIIDGTGALDAHSVAWADIMTARKRGHVPDPTYITAQSRNLKPIYDSAPLLDAASKHFEQDVPEWLRISIQDSEKENQFFRDLDFTAALEKATIPILQATGWTDSMLSIVLRQHDTLASRERPASLTIGPWSHIGTQSETILEQFEFIEEHLRGRTPPKGSRGAQPVRAFVTGADEWRGYSQWPPVPASTQIFHLGPGGNLSSDEPYGEASTSTFTFDPTRPTPSVGLPRPLDGSVPTTYEDSTLAVRSDVAMFDSAPLSAELEVIGPPTIELQHSSDNPNFDLLVRVSEVRPNGRSTRISDQYKRFFPGQHEGTVKLTLTDCAHRFRKGNKIRVLVAGGAHPAMVRNLGTGENRVTGKTMKPAVHTIHFSADQVSRLTLPLGSQTASSKSSKRASMKPSKRASMKP